MKNTKLKLLPPMLMLVAGSIASIMTYYFQYEVKAALLILSSVLLIFYILGLIIVNVIMHFDRVNEEKRLAEEQEAMENMAILEGTQEESVLEGEASKEDTQNPEGAHDSSQEE